MVIQVLIPKLGITLRVSFGCYCLSFTVLSR